ncbi:folylpolyglutamate synthase/dihydrofolate synthase family protein [Oscillibacter sp.]|uniref:bifunctional folylpolyglutamate synthase/dihydrofolate synthase n=1 Tax=Oscillibacter sp. TaxID=1945593 RepID=UPI0026054F01|nr:folylpolyglutamate synthase/dihydrofolate synthase family protein [Oscillibacter sp.]MDD3346360.1 bifunctional folylpolyglutamate synthase/dihydrofolate synthase [Oscillibacter sp.]
MTGTEAIAYIHSCNWQKHAPGLGRIRALLHALGDPQAGMKFVHVAGTNGKGSTCALLASMLQEAPYRVGLNTSPYLVTFHERIQVDGVMISDEALARLTERVRPAAEAMAEHPTEFELITAIALLYFKECGCDIVVLEVGLGGALDASNVIDVPEVAVLTAMGMDHMELLGPTLTDIAEAKAGIIKHGGKVVSYGGCPEADAVFQTVCRERGAALRAVDFSRLRQRRLDLTGSAFDFAPYEGLEIPLAGTYQMKNASTAITAIEVLREKGWIIPEEAVRRGLAAVSWPGRFELLRREPTVLLDGAHNAHGMTAAAESLRALFPGQKIVFLLGVLADKNVEQMLEVLTPLARRVFTVRPDSPRALGAETLCRLLQERGSSAEMCETVAEGVRAALGCAGAEGVVCALGSLYFSGDVRFAVKQLCEEP